MAKKRNVVEERTSMRVYTYMRVTKSMQIDGYSLEAQWEKIKAYAD